MTQVCINTAYESQVTELQAFIKKERDARQLKKALAVKMVYQGYKHEIIVQILGVAMGSITSWRQLYESEGLAGFRPKHKGRKSYLSGSQRTAVISWLKNRKKWDLGELESHLVATYGVRYESKQSYYDLFEAAGISWKDETKRSPKKGVKVLATQMSQSSDRWCAVGG